MLDVFRQLPVFPDHHPLNTVMWFDTRATPSRSATEKGMVFGQTSVVNSFRRCSTFAVGTGTSLRSRSWTWHKLMISSQWKWCSASSQHGKFWLEPQTCLESSSGNTKPDGHLRKQTGQDKHVRSEDLGSNRITFESVSGTVERRAQDLTQGSGTSAHAAKFRGQKVGCDGGLCSNGEACAGASMMEAV